MNKNGPERSVEVSRWLWELEIVGSIPAVPKWSVAEREGVWIWLRRVWVRVLPLQ